MESTPPPGNNPPELPTGSKRKTNDGDMTGGTSKRHQTGKEDDTATSANMRRLWNNKDLDLLVNIQDYHEKRGSYPFGDLLKQREFYKKWIEGNGDYKDYIKMNEKMDELNGKFLRNLYRKSNGEDVESFMDDVDKEIFRISNIIWGKKENDQLNVVAVNDPTEVEIGDDNDGGANPNEG